MADNATLRLIFASLVKLLESQQRQIDELHERALSIEGAAKLLVDDFAEARENTAALISNATQYKIAEKADKYAELRAQVERLLPL